MERVFGLMKQVAAAALLLTLILPSQFLGTSLAGEMPKERSPRLGCGLGFANGWLLGTGGSDLQWDSNGVEAYAAYRMVKHLVWTRLNGTYVETVQDNSLLIVSVGPELVFHVWRLEPFLDVFLGASRNSEAQWEFAWNAGVGMRFMLTRGFGLEATARAGAAGDVVIRIYNNPLEEDVVFVPLFTLGMRVEIPGT
jgi:hypothetical protein